MLKLVCSASRKLVGARAFSALPSHKVLNMPALSPTMTSGNLKSWLKKVGDELKAGDSIAEIETDKATVGYETVDDGFLARVFVPGDSNDIPVGVAIALTVENKEDIAAFDSFVPPVVPQATTAPVPAAAAAPAVHAQPAAPTPKAPAPVAGARYPLVMPGLNISFKHALSYFVAPTPVAVAAPAPAPKAAPPAAAPSSAPEYYAFEAWGTTLKVKTQCCVCIPRFAMLAGIPFSLPHPAARSDFRCAGAGAERLRRRVWIRWPGASPPSPGPSAREEEAEGLTLRMW